MADVLAHYKITTMKKILNYIDGQLQEALSKQFIENESPVNGQVFSHTADSDKEDVELAVEAAKRAFPYWSGLSKQERHDHMMHLADGIQARFDEMVAAR
jgi:acyl-CoA reductase-like NAD-dependent aldehyde dehydrogenase